MQVGRNNPLGPRPGRSAEGPLDPDLTKVNRDGIQDPTEEGVNGIEIELYDVDRNLVAWTTSQNLDNDSAKPGYYWFGDLEPGQYFIKLVKVPISWNTMSPDIGDDSVDSDIDPLTNESTLITVDQNGLIRTVDVGFFIPQGPIVCEDSTDAFDPTDTNVDRREVPDASECPN